VEDFSRRRCEEAEAQTNESQCSNPGELRAPFGQLFQRDVQRQPGDPGDVHHATDEQEEHKEKTTAEAEGAVLDPHTERSCRSLPPPCGQKLYRIAASGKTGSLKRGQLIDARSDENSA